MHPNSRGFALTFILFKCQLAKTRGGRSFAWYTQLSAIIIH